MRLPHCPHRRGQHRRWTRPGGTFPAVAPGATAARGLVGVTVTDTRAGLAGWLSSISTTDVASVATSTSTPSAHVSYVPEAALTVGAVTVTAATVAAGASTVQAATAVHGNTAVWHAALSVHLPADALRANDYGAVLAHAVI
jgi:hypothetical protein